MARPGSHRFVDHIAELELELEAPTQEGVLAEAALALGELLGGSEDTSKPVARRLSVAAPDNPALLAAWLEELVFLAETEGFVPGGAESVAVREGSASGVVTGRYGSPPHLVKGVTYHDLELAGDDTGWRGRVVLDV